MRDDLLLAEEAKRIGWTVVRDPRDKNQDVTPCFPLVFVLGEKHVWFCAAGWACADLIAGRFRNHRYYEKLNDALLKEAENAQDQVGNECGCSA